MFCRLQFTPTEEELLDIQERFSEEGSKSHLYIPENFVATGTSYVANSPVNYSAGTVISVCIRDCMMSVGALCRFNSF